jgi:hypothetical protein
MNVKLDTRDPNADAKRGVRVVPMPMVTKTVVISEL